MNFKLFLALTGTVGWLLSCGSGPAPAADPPQDAHQQEESQTESGDHALYLNEGKRWLVDSGMMVYLRTMESAVLNSNVQDMAAYEVLSETLQRESDLLTSNCTMKGEAHDVLHLWLVPYLDLVQAFADAETVEERSSLYT